jgi:diguanylate cyclase (GGDEF)-like protein
MIHLGSLLRAIHTVSVAYRETETLRRQVAALQEENAALRAASVEAHIDELTGAFNRRWLRTAWNDAPSPALEFAAIVLIDIDRFKSINDRYGHKVGDHAIVHVAEALRKHCPSVIRTGGDEFVLLIPRGQSVRDTADAILHETRRPLPTPSGQLTTTISVGVCRLDETHKQIDLSDALERADWAMYRAKRSRGDQVVVA